MNSSLLNLNYKDVAKGLITAVLTGIVVAIYQIVSAPDFDFFAVNLNILIHTSVNAGGAALIGYLAKNLLTSSDGKVLGANLGPDSTAK